MARIKLILAYEGTDFSGWQLQARDRTVQGEVEAAIVKIAGARIPVNAAGRTDAGVHALGQCAHFDAPEALGHIPWAVALNGLMRPDVRILRAGVAHPRFHARYDALSKTYAYTLWLDRAGVCPLRRRFVWGMQQALDLAAMDEAAALFVGTHDFKSFKNAGTDVGARGTVRTVMALWREPGQTPAEITWRIRANGFLKQMVRNIMGCLVSVGQGKVAPQDVRSIIDRRDRTHALPTAPPWGLCMERVFYPEDQEAARSQDTAHDEHQMAGRDHRAPLGPDRNPAD
ncbi:MAG: tRNA pseudouridine(38-40) synthase TruA [Proteobacteria bacterium]|nr:tRNA pseudouridine(38-40) synthase TruA [Pseudomonadota bacterium]MBU1596626.1 tRNA pseudouridine(38-40) synthase TruA [Pseudomonadota bacterium]